MRELLVVETRDAAEHRDPARVMELVAGMHRNGIPATVFLTENAAFNARSGAFGAVDEAVSKGITIAVDRFALEERGILEDQLSAGIAVADVGLIVDRLRSGSCVMWR